MLFIYEFSRLIEIDMLGLKSQLRVQRFLLYFLDNVRETIYLIRK